MSLTTSRRLTLSLAAVLVCFSGGHMVPHDRATAEEPKPPPAKDAIRAVLDAQVVAWNKGDLDGFMKGYWESKDLTFFSGGTKTSGWQATLERYQKKYKADGKEMGQLTFSELDIDVLSADSAGVRGRWKLKMSKEEPGGLYTLIFKRFPDGWRIVHDHTSADLPK
jgi:ketosteroid isomerase-like protein